MVHALWAHVHCLDVAAVAAAAVLSGNEHVGPCFFCCTTRHVFQVRLAVLLAGPTFPPVPRM